MQFNNDLIVIYSCCDVLFTEGLGLRGKDSESDVTDLYGGVILCKKRYGLLYCWDVGLMVQIVF